MKKLFDVKCTACGKTDEVFGELEAAFRCTVCSSVSKRVISPVRVAFKGGGFPGHDMKWARDHERAAKRGDNQ